MAMRTMNSHLILQNALVKECDNDTTNFRFAQRECITHLKGKTEGNRVPLLLDL